MTKTITFLDGGMGQELIRRSGLAPTPLWSARVMLDNPQLVEDLHIDFIRAGARVIGLNNYTATPARLARDASADLFTPIHKAAQTAAQNAREKAGDPTVQIAGCLPPLIASYKPELAPGDAECLAQYRALVEIQKDAIDVMMCETIATIREAVAAVTASTEAGLRTAISFTLDDDNPLQLRSGEALADAIDAVTPLGPDAIMVNCSWPETVSKAMPQLTSRFAKTGGYANGFQSITALDAGGTTAGLKAREDLGPDAYAAYALGWANAGARVIGGCCEVGPAHIEATAAALRHTGYKLTGF